MNLIFIYKLGIDTKNLWRINKMNMKERATEVRKALKENFSKDWKFGVTTTHNTIRVTIKQGDVDFGSKYEQINDHWYKDHYKETPEIVAVFDKIVPMLRAGNVNRNAGDPYADYCDYNFYPSVHVGAWDRDYINVRTMLTLLLYS